MTDGPGSTPDVPSGWAAEQPPPYGAAAGSWASPGAQGGPAGSSGPHQDPGGPHPHTANPGTANPGAPGAPGAYPPGPHAAGPYGGPQGGSYGGPQGGPHAGPYGGPQGGPYAGPHGGPQGGPYGYRPPDAPRPGVIPLRPLALGDILDGTIKLIRSNPKTMLGLSAIVAAITAIPAAVGDALSLETLGVALTDPDAADPAGLGSGVLAQYVGAIVSLFMTFVGSTILTGILTRVLGRAVFGGRLTVGEAWRLARARLPALFGLVLLQSLILLLPLLALFAVIVVLAAADALDGLGIASAGAGALTAVVFILAYIPYLLFFYTRLSLAAPAIVLEGRGVTDAMSRSWRLVRGDSWRVLGILLLTSLLVGVIGAALSVPFTLGGSLIGALGDGAPAAIVAAALLIALGSVLSSMITYPFQAGVTGLLYADRRMRAEAFDLVLQTAAAQNHTQGWIHAGVDDLWHPGYAAGAEPAAGPGGGPYHGAPPSGPYGPHGPQA